MSLNAAYRYSDSVVAESVYLLVLALQCDDIRNFDTRNLVLGRRSDLYSQATILLWLTSVTSVPGGLRKQVPPGAAGEGHKNSLNKDRPTSDLTIEHKK